MMKAKKKMGRPTLPDNKKRVNDICIGFNDAEMKVIEMKASKLKVRKYTLIRIAIDRLTV